MEKRGQTTAYIILAIVIVVFGIIVYFLYPRIGSILGTDTQPGDYMKACIAPAVDEGLSIISKQGGYIDPEGYILYQGQKVKYLCYTTHYYQPCYVQQPLLVSHVEKELSEYLESKARTCINDLKKYNEERGYEVIGGNTVDVDVSITQKVVGVTVTAPITFKRDSTQEFRTFKFGKASEMYSLLMTAVSIVDFESTYGDSETMIYMQYYPELQLRKNKLIDGSTVYSIKNVKTAEEFTFASRSLAWPGGLGFTA
ncbi:MAG: hypothetical protein KKD18_05865 [Nanoarchaeota archaeon]|nr:hypothetical protein [Nanoarchaeota archaeon]MBU0977917.1 hypothetical protein [Nanoarchaeota archaeon]